MVTHVRRQRWIGWLVQGLVLIGIVGLSPWAVAQVGPNLRPPGLKPDEPIDHPSDKDRVKKSTGDGPTSNVAILDGAWALNAESVVFSAAKKRQLTSEAPSTIHVITDRQINLYGWRTLAETLRMVPGVETRTWLAQYQSVMIRGLLGTEVNNTRILWLENGVPFNDVRDGGIWLDQTYPVELIKRIEVVLGPGSSLYGTGAFQGVVNIFTKDPRNVAENGEYRLGFGSENTLKTSALVGTSIGDLELLLFGSANMTNGPGLISDHRLRQLEREAGATAVRSGDSPLDSAYDPKGVETNSDRGWQTLYLKATYDPVRVSVGFRNIDAGFDGAEFFATERYRFNRREASAEVVVDQALGESASLLGVVAYRLHQNIYEDYFDLDLDKIVEIQSLNNVSNDPRYPSRLDEKVNFTTDQHKLFSLAQFQFQLHKTNELIVGLGGRYESIRAPEFQTDKVEQSFVNGSVFLQDEQRLFNNDLILTAGARFDTHREFGPQLSFRGAALYKWTDWLLSRLSYGTAFKEPSMSQLYIDHFNTTGNDQLNAETLQNVELSTVVRPIQDLTFRVDAFATFMDNLILNEFDQNLAVPFLGIDGKFVSRQENAARILGFEVSARAEVNAGVNLFAHYNFLDSKARRCDACDFETLDYDAQHRIGLGAAYSNEDAVLSFMTFFVGETVDSLPALPGEEALDGGQQTVPMYVLFQPQARVRLPGGLGAMVQGTYALSEGLGTVPTNDAYYEMLEVPVPRLTLFAALLYPYIE